MDVHLINNSVDIPSAGSESRVAKTSQLTTAGAAIVCVCYYLFVNGGGIKQTCQTDIDVRFFIFCTLKFMRVRLLLLLGGVWL